MKVDMDEIPSRNAKFKKSHHIWMSKRYIDHVERMPRQRFRNARWGPTPAKKTAVTQ